MNIVLTGGGTAGHIMPNIAIVGALEKRFSKVIYIGSENSMEERICKSENIQYYPTETEKFNRKNLLKNLALPRLLSRSRKEAENILEKEKISLVFSKGGYAAVPAVLAAKRRKIPVVCHESDRTLGLANRLTASFAKKVYTAFPNTFEKAEVLPTPIRPRIFDGKPFDLFPNAKPVLLFLGGSLGAKAINDALSVSLADLTKRYNVLHIGGASVPPLKTPSYVSVPFAEDIENYFATADLVISRGGASTLGELTALGKRVLVIPLPKGPSRGDQVLNAAYYLAQGAVNVLPQSELTPDNLLGAIKHTIMSRPPAPTYDRRTPEILADALFEIAKEGLSAP